MKDSALTRFFVTTGITTYFKRVNKIKDPVVRYSTFVEQLRIIFEIGLNILKEELEHDIEDRDLSLDEIEDEKERATKLREIQKDKQSLGIINELMENFEKYFDNFSDWISQPTYSPDHPFGDKMMKEAKESFEKF